MKAHVWAHLVVYLQRLSGGGGRVWCWSPRCIAAMSNVASGGGFLHFPIGGFRAAYQPTGTIPAKLLRTYIRVSSVSNNLWLGKIKRDIWILISITHCYRGQVKGNAWVWDSTRSTCRRRASDVCYCRDRAESPGTWYRDAQKVRWVSPASADLWFTQPKQDLTVQLCKMIFFMAVISCMWESVSSIEFLTPQGCLDTAKRMVKEATAAGADCVKFQKTSLEHRAVFCHIINFLSSNSSYII